MTEQTKTMAKLAIHGGEPVRDKPLPPNFPGAIVMGEEEAQAASGVIMDQSPFRYYGENLHNTVQQLEDMICEDFNVPYALGVSSCTAALVVALKALGIGYGDKVIVPSVTFIATAGAVVSSNAVPVFVECDESLNLDPNDLERVMDEDVKAIIAVSLVGTPCDMDKIMDFAEKHDIYVVEDVAQSLGVQYKGRYQGTIGHVGVLSFQMNKIITAGEGGAVLTSDPKIFERAIRYHDQGILRGMTRDRYGFTEIDENEAAFAGQNYRMSEITGAVLVEQWKKLSTLNANTRKHYRTICKRLREALPNIQFRVSPDPEGDLGLNVGIRVSTREQADHLKSALNAENIDARTMYNGNLVYMNPQILHQRTAEKNNFPFDYPFKQPVKYTEDMCPRSADIVNRIVLIPISPVLTEEDVESIVAGVIKVYRHL